MCQMVATFFCVQFSPKLQETHIETELPSAGWKQAQIPYYFIFIFEIRDRLLVFSRLPWECQSVTSINIFREHTKFWYFIV